MKLHYQISLWRWLIMWIKNSLECYTYFWRKKNAFLIIICAATYSLYLVMLAYCLFIYMIQSYAPYYTNPIRLSLLCKYYKWYIPFYYMIVAHWLMSWLMVGITFYYKDQKITLHQKNVVHKKLVTVLRYILVILGSIFMLPLCFEVIQPYLGVWICRYFIVFGVIMSGAYAVLLALDCAVYWEISLAKNMHNTLKIMLHNIVTLVALLIIQTGLIGTCFVLLKYCSAVLIYGCLYCLTPFIVMPYYLLYTNVSK